MAIAYVSASSGSGVGTATQVATLSTATVTAVPAGAAVCIMVGALNFTTGDTVSITDNASGNTYTQVDPATSLTPDWAGSSNYNAATFVGLNIQNGPTVFTVHYSHSGGVAFGIIAASTFTGTLTSGALGGHVLTAPAQNTTTGANVTASAAYTSTVGSLLWACAFNVVSGGTTSAGTTLAWVAGQTLASNEGMTEYILSGPGGSNAATFGKNTAGDDVWLVGSMELKAATTDVLMAQVCM